jgi:glutamyl-Q tRNA(Asp) synthetase
MQPTFRFAPSPTGLLHLGHALSATCVWRAAEAAGGRVLLRIEDIDPVRAKPKFADAIEEDLAWLGFRWEGEAVRQSERMDLYGAALDRLAARGLTYECRLTRSELAAGAAKAEAREGRLWPRDPDGAPRLPLGIVGAMGGPAATRLRMAEAAKAAGPLTWQELGEGPSGETGRLPAAPETWGDVVLARKDVATSYQLSVVVDDAAQGVTDIVRGQDLFHATAVHRLLQQLLGLPEPRYRHHRLILAEDGMKLAKTRGSPSLRSLRERGWTASDVFRAIEPFLPAPNAVKPTAKTV